MKKQKYNAEQERVVKLGKSKKKAMPDKLYGDISDLDASKYDANQMDAVSLGRGSCANRANIDDLDPEKHDGFEFEDISWDRYLKLNNISYEDYCREISYEDADANKLAAGRHAI